MQATRFGLITLATAASAALALSVRADITSLAGSAEVTIQEYVSGRAGSTAQARQQFPQPNATLPLQVVARLSLSGEEPAAAAAAAQFADPLNQAQPNPEEFAINLALLSVSKTTRYSADATTEEIRGIVFTTREFPLRESGETITLTGRLFLDGALAVFSPTAQRDLTGANVYLRVTVVKQVTGQADETVFSGRVGLQGGASGGVQQIAEGDFPTQTLIRSDLAPFIDDFDVFELLLLPQLAIDYPYTATIDQPFALRATVAVEAGNAEDETGVAAIIGTPLDSIEEVINAARGSDAAAKTINALQRERANPTGRPAFPAARPLLPVCGLFGFEFLLGGGALVGLRLAGRRQRSCFAH